jgi:hypothetical protein
MTRTLGLISVVVVVGIGSYVYTRQTQSVTSIGSNPETTVDVLAVRNDLMAIANAERRYWASNARYASLDELRSKGDIEVPSRNDFAYSVEASDTTFTIVASYSGSDPNAPKRISLNETMTITTE